VTINTFRRYFLAVLGFFTVSAKPSNAGILEDVRKSAVDGAEALLALGYKADSSFESIEELERFMADNVMPNGRAKPNSQLSEAWGGKMFMFGSYLGEVIRRKTNGQWRGDDSDPEVEINIEILTSNGVTIWPMQRMLKRFHNGEEDNLWDYANSVVDG
jgi:hypothetical protein